MPNTSTTCKHNAEGQVLKPGIPVPCRMCGALLEPEAGSVGANGAVHAGQVKQKYPGGHQG